MKLLDAITLNKENLFMRSRLRDKVIGFEINGLPINALTGAVIDIGYDDWNADDWQILSEEEFLDITCMEEASK